MTPLQFRNLKDGDIIRRRGESDRWIVDCNFGKRVIAVATRDVSNPIEWDLILVANYTEPENE